METIGARDGVLIGGQHYHAGWLRLSHSEQRGTAISFLTGSI